MKETVELTGTLDIGAASYYRDRPILLKNSKIKRGKSSSKTAKNRKMGIQTQPCRIVQPLAKRMQTRFQRV
jgi:hypothetical protein